MKQKNVFIGIGTLGAIALIIVQFYDIMLIGIFGIVCMVIALIGTFFTFPKKVVKISLIAAMVVAFITLIIAFIVNPRAFGLG